MKKYILITEDQENISALLKMSFEERGVSVRVAKDGDEAIKAIARADTFRSSFAEGRWVWRPRTY